MHKIMNSYMWLEFVVIFYSFEVYESIAVLFIITLHFNVMAHRVVSIQRGQTRLDFWAVRKNWGLMLTQIGLEMLFVLFIAAFFARSISIWHNKFAIAARYISSQRKHY
jgi:hypothetical protein